MTLLKLEIAKRGWQVPSFTAASLEARRAKYALCIFVINEGQRLVSQLERMQPWCGAVDIILADGGSTDGSTAANVLGALGVHTLLTKTGPGKLSAQMRMALAYCLIRDYAGVLVMDGNNKDDPAAIPRFVNALEEGVDHVQGSRFVPGGQAINTPPSRYWGIRLLHAPVISMAAGYHYTDTTNGFRAYSRRFLLDPRVVPFRDAFSHYELHYYLAVKAPVLGFRVQEVPVTRAYPSTGHTPTKIHGFRGNWRVLRTLVGSCRWRFVA